jgi:hypothetical protein
MSLDDKLEDRRLLSEMKQAFLESSLFLISQCMQFWYVSVVPRYLNFTTLSSDLLVIGPSQY